MLLSITSMEQFPNFHFEYWSQIKLIKFNTKVVHCVCSYIRAIVYHLPFQLD